MKMLPFFSGGLAAGVLLWIAPRRGAAAPADLLVTVGPTVEITRSHSWCWFPTIHRFRSGEILVSMVMSPDQVNSEGAFSAYCLSRDGGRTWSRRYTMGLGANQDGAWTDQPDDQDQIWQWGSYSEPAQEGDDRHFLAAMTKYSQGGRRVAIDLDVSFETLRPATFYPTWLFAYRFDHKNPVPDTRIRSQFGGRPWGTIIRGRQGELYCSGYYTTVEDAQRTAAEANGPAPRRFFHDVCYRSTDGGQHWSEQGVIAAVPPGERPAWMGDEGPNEGSLTLLPDGRLYAVYRTGGKGGMIGNAWSSDGGKSWTPLASIGFTGVAPRIHRLHNGMLVVTTGRPGPVVLHCNLDGTGREWSHPVTIYSEMSTRYTDVAEVAPGQLLVVYDHVPYGWYEIPFADRDARNIIYGTFVTVSKN